MLVVKKIVADLVVYGKIFTAEKNHVAEAFAVKDGKYIYVGDKSHAVESFGTMIDRADSVEKFLTEIVPAAAKKAKSTGAKAVYGMGWNTSEFLKNMPTRHRLDAICNDIPMFFADEEIVLDSNGIPTGYLKEQAQNYVRSFPDNESLYSVDMAKADLAKVEQILLPKGYTMYPDGFSTYLFNDTYYKAARQFDKAGDMHFILGTTYEIESWMDVDSALAKAHDVKKFASKHVLSNRIKLFMDGTVETGTGFIEPLYNDGHQGIPNWSEEELTCLIHKANANDLTIHIHSMGNKGVTRVVNAFINGGKDEMRNTLVHIYSVNPSDYKRMAEHNIYVTEGMLWHHAPDKEQSMLFEILPEPLTRGYPMKSYFDNDITMSSHSDFPALSGSPDDPFGIMEVMLTGVYYPEKSKAWWTEKLITREQAITALTINVAKQMFLEKQKFTLPNCH